MSNISNGIRKYYNSFFELIIFNNIFNYNSFFQIPFPKEDI